MNKTAWHGIGTTETVLYFNIVNDTLLHYYLKDFVVNGHVQDPEQSLINDNLTEVSIIKSTIKE